MVTAGVKMSGRTRRAARSKRIIEPPMLQVAVAVPEAFRPKTGGGIRDRRVSVSA